MADYDSLVIVPLLPFPPRMFNTASDPDPEVRPWPSLSEAARYLGVAESALSRRDVLGGERMGLQEIRLSPTTVTRLAREYRRRIVDEVVFDLVEHAREHAPDQVEPVELEIDAFFRRNPVAAPDVAEDLARRHLPPHCIGISR